jgi:hypothetical protein
MVVGADRDKETKTGKMLPLHRMCYHWKPMADLLPLSPLPPSAWSELRELLARVPLDQPVARFYVASLPDGLGPLAPHFTSAWEAARFLVDEVVSAGDQPLARFCAAVADGVHESALRAALDDWRERYFPGATTRHPSNAVGAADFRQGSVIVRLAPSGDPSALTLTLAAIVAGATTPVYQGKVPAGKVRRIVEQKVSEAIQQIPPDLDVMIEFELPQRWLTKPVDEWHADPQEKYPLGWSYPVVVRHLPLGGSFDRSRRLYKRWKKFCEQATLHQLDCIDCRDVRDHRNLAAWLLASTDRSVLALANPPKPPDQHAALQAGLYAGVPVMLWSRHRCVDGHTDDRVCAGDRFLRALMEALADVRPAELPQAIRTLRAKAVGIEDNESCGQSLTLFWDDPRRQQDFDPPLELAD